MSRYDNDAAKCKAEETEEKVERIADAQCPWCKSRNAIIKNGMYRCPRCSYECDVSVPPEIKVIGWTTARDNDYIDFDCKTSAIYRAIVNEIKEKEYSFDWSAHQSDNLPCTPVINNGYKIYCGPRTWGWIMAEAHGADPSDEAAYAEYAFCLVDNPVYPVKSVDYQLIIPFEIKE